MDWQIFDRRRSQMDETKRTHRVAILGPSGVGKSSLISRQKNPNILEGEFCSISSTIGVDCFNTKVGTTHGDVDLVIFDTAGQDHFRESITFYLRDISVAAVCFDPTKPDWLKNATEYKKMVTGVNAHCGFVAIATKSDLWEFDLKEPDIRRQVLNTLEIKNFVITCAIKGIGVSEAFQAIAEVASGVGERTSIPLVDLTESSARSCAC
jgi:small GTP-binding protein